MKTRLLFFIVLFFAQGLGCIAATPARPVVAGYVFAQDAPLQNGQIDASRLTRVNYAFANIKDGKIVTGFASDVQNYAFLTGLRKQNPSLTVLTSVGGWLWSTNFSDVSLTRQSRSIFIQSVMSFLRRFDLDGLDIDWEYPGMVGAGHPFRPQDKENFTALLKELRQEFDREEAKTHRKLYLTIAAGSSDDFIAHTEMEKVAKYVDTVNLMAYDYLEPDSDAVTGHHSPLFHDPADNRNFSTDQSVRAFESAGVPAEKIVLGIPFYGHAWGQVPDVNHGFLQSGHLIPNFNTPYKVIAGTLLNQGYVRYWDSAASAPWLYNAQTHIFVTYEDPESIAAKGHYVLQNKLAGIMFWEYFGDANEALLKAVNQSLGLDQTPGAPAQ